MENSLFPLDTPAPTPTAHIATRPWAAELIVERYLPNLSRHDHVLEPTCAEGNFLDALRCVRKLGVELDPDLAAIAQRRGHNVIVGDIRTVPLPDTLTAAIGSPPFSVSLTDAILDRLHSLFPENGRAVFLLPTYFFQTSSHVLALRDRWSISVDLIPKNLFRLEQSICVATLVKNRDRLIFGLALYDEVHDVTNMNADTQAALNGPGTWSNVVLDALERLGGTATLPQLYRIIEPSRPSGSIWWQNIIRRELQVHIKKGRARRISDGVFTRTIHAG